MVRQNIMYLKKTMTLLLTSPTMVEVASNRRGSLTNTYNARKGSLYVFWLCDSSS